MTRAAKSRASAASRLRRLLNPPLTPGPGRRAVRVFGWLALAGVVVLVLSVAAGALLELFQVDTRSVIGPVALVAVMFVLAFWPLWMVWGRTLDQAVARVGPGRLDFQARTELIVTAILMLGVVCLVGSYIVAQIVVDGSDALASVLITALIVAAVTIVGSIVFASIAGGILLAGAAWWWVGVLFSAGFGLLVWQLFTDGPWITGVLVLAAGCGGYFLALRVGQSKKRRSAIAAEEFRRQDQASGGW